MLSPHAYAVIMAGGSGTRLWPLSRQGKPKQFQRFFSDKTMLEETYDRVARFVPTERIFVSTTERYRDLVLAELKGFSEDNIILEPEPRGTAAAILWSALHVSERDPDAVIATLASDHAIKNPDAFGASLATAFAAAEKYPDAIVTLGINPTRPDTGLGYIKLGEELEEIEGNRVFQAEAFKEKPDRATAEHYLAAWDYLWNAGYFVFTARGFIPINEELAPEMTATLKNAFAERRPEAYATVANEPIDTLIAERLPAERRLVVPAPLEWSDVGNWLTLYEFLQADGEGMPSIVSRGRHLDLGSERCFIHGEDKLIATIGLEDTVVIESKDAILVAHKDKVQDIKKVIETLKEKGLHHYL